MTILDMSVHRTLSYTSKFTIDTRNGFFSCMYHDMSFHISLILHNLIAKRTPILSCSNPNWFNLQNKQRQENRKKYSLFYQYFGNPWTFLMCELQLLAWEKVLGQYSHENGLSPVCILMCLVISLWFFIILMQKGHLYCPAPSLTGSICKISRQKKIEKSNLLFYQYFGIPWTFLTCELQLPVWEKVIGQ